MWEVEGACAGFCGLSQQYYVSSESFSVWDKVKLCKAKRERKSRTEHLAWRSNVNADGICCLRGGFVAVSVDMAAAAKSALAPLNVAALKDG